MSDIALFDSNSGKFSFPIKEYWESQGHTVTYEYGYNPTLANQSDVVFIDVCDNNAVVATTGGPFGEEGIIPDGKKLVIRAIDIEVWSGFHAQVKWNKVSDVIFIAKHIEERARQDVDFEFHGVKVHHIPCGVDMNKFTLRKRPEKNNRIAFVAELWHAKGITTMLEIANLLPRDYQIYVLGKWAIESWYKAWMEYYIKDNNLNVSFGEHYPDMNEFLEDKAYALCCSVKEAFSYSIAEGMAKGMKPIIFNFLGAKDIWPERFIYNTAQEAVDMILSEEFEPYDYRIYIKDNYSLDDMMTKINQVCGLDN